MVAQRLDGKACAAKVEQELLTRIAACLDKKTQPHLAVVIVGDEKITTLFSDNAKPLVDRYKFIKGFQAPFL